MLCLSILATVFLVPAQYRQNITPQPDFFNVCSESGANSEPCVDQTLKAIHNARSQEGIKLAMVLPDDFASLTVAEQVFVETNLERVARGLRPFEGLSRKLDAVAHDAAVARDDPTLDASLAKSLHIQAWGSIWASDLGSLAADYDWMYNDGYAKGNVNEACRTPQSAACWAHRKDILRHYHHLPVLLAGAGASSHGQSIAEIFSGGTGSAPLVYTWKQALAHGANNV